MTTTIVHQLANSFIERAEFLGLKGKKRDDEALTYWVGAAKIAEITGHADLAHTLGLQASLIIAVRGFIGVKEIQRTTEQVQRQEAILAQARPLVETIVPARDNPLRRGPVVKPFPDLIGSHRMGRISNHTKAEISQTVGFGPNGEGDGGEKVNWEWTFTIDGVPCAIWDWKGSARFQEWSFYGPKDAFVKIFPAATLGD